MAKHRTSATTASVMKKKKAHSTQKKRILRAEKKRIPRSAKMAERAAKAKAVATTLLGEWPAEQEWNGANPFYVEQYIRRHMKEYLKKDDILDDADMMTGTVEQHYKRVWFIYGLDHRIEKTKTSGDYSELANYLIGTLNTAAWDWTRGTNTDYHMHHSIITAKTLVYMSREGKEKDAIRDSLERKMLRLTRWLPCRPSPPISNHAMGLAEFPCDDYASMVSRVRFSIFHNNTAANEARKLLNRKYDMMRDLMHVHRNKAWRNISEKVPAGVSLIDVDDAIMDEYNAKLRQIERMRAIELAGHPVPDHLKHVLVFPSYYNTHDEDGKEKVFTFTDLYLPRGRQVSINNRVDYDWWHRTLPYTVTCVYADARVETTLLERVLDLKYLINRSNVAGVRVHYPTTIELTEAVYRTRAQYGTA